jgi:RNA polymerase sigma-70 factor (ECF subfamily)
MWPLASIVCRVRAQEPSAATAELEALLQSVVARGRAAWPALAVPPEALVGQLAQRLPEGSVEPRLPSLRAGDLHLACACAHGLAAAVAELESGFMARVPDFVRRIETSPSFATEVQQILRTKLLVAELGAQPRIAEFNGTCSLETWLRLLAVRTALDLVRRRPEQLNPSQDAAGKPLADALDLERDLLCRLYRDDFQTALEEALATLAPKERLLLRQYFVENMTIDELGDVHGVHRATCARWLASTREKLLDRTRRRVIERLRLSPSEFDSLAGLMVSGLQLTLAAG